MAVRTPRRSFASPFVAIITAVPACYLQSAPPQQPANPHVQPAEPPAHAPPSVVMNPPRPQPDAPVAGTSWQVSRTADGCEALLATHCPAGVSCNPPPPQKYDCPPDLLMGKPITVVAAGDGTCHVEQPPVQCPPHAMCNPPRPQPIACPK